MAKITNGYLEWSGWQELVMVGQNGLDSWNKECLVRMVWMAGIINGWMNDQDG